MFSKSARPLTDSQPLAIAGWVVAGIPILVSGIQAVSYAMEGTVEGWPVIGGVAAAIKSIPEFQRMALAFSPNTPSLILFLLIAAAWVVLGLTLFRPFSVFRDYSQGLRFAAGIATTFLYVLLFGSAYQELLFGGPEAEMVAVLLIIPIIVLIGIYTAFKAQPPTDGHRLLNDAEVELTSLEAEFDRQLEKLDKRWQTLDADDRIAIGIESVSEDAGIPAIKKGRKRIDNHRERIERIRSKSEVQRASDARDLLEDIKSLSAAGLRQEVEGELYTDLAELLRDEYTPEAICIESDALGELRTYNITESVGSIQIDVGDDAPQAFEKFTLRKIENIAKTVEVGQGSFEDAIAVVDSVSQRVSAVRQDVLIAEDTFVTRHEEVRETLGDVTQRLNEIGETDAVKEAITDIYRDGQSEYNHGVTSLPDLRDRLDTAVDRHYQCDFDGALEILNDVEGDAGKLETALIALWKIDHMIANQSSSVPVSGLSSFDSDIFVRDIVDNDISGRLTRASCKLDTERDRAVFDYEDSVDSYQSTGINTDEGPPPDSVDVGPEDPDELDRDVLNQGIEVVFRTIRDGGEAVSFNENKGEIIVNKNKIKKPFDSDTIMRTAANHIEQQSTVDVDIDRRELDDGIRFTVGGDPNEGLSRRQVGKRLLQSYKDSSTVIN
jgi:hypothetical protein